ncbi:hypothetical protein I4U23_023105 [Adineta vaga]|nr:hypothetical protein I4U23_023105 [Adineta vaga]
MDNLMPELYENLMSLCSRNIGFYFKDSELDSIKYRVFNYRLCSYEQFHNFPSALNCRGILFNITDPENIQLVSLPPEKFFNYEEGNGLKIHPLGKFGVQMEKLDGSLISTYLHKGEVRLKSKTALGSSQATEAMTLLTGKYLDEVKQIVCDNKTVNFELTSPTNRIILYYNESKLRILSIRCHLTGDTLFGDRLIQYLKEKQFSTMIENVVSFKQVSGGVSHERFVDDIRNETEGEGYVVEIISSDKKCYLIKIKNHKYLLLHHTKSSCTSAKYLCQCVINEQTDDIRALFIDENATLQRITDMENKVRPVYNQLVHTVESFYEENKGLSRKDYAIKISNIKDLKIYMPLLMNLYGGKEVDFKKFAVDRMKDIFDITEDTNIDIDENL